MADNGATLGEIIAAYWPVVVVSFAVPLALTPLCRRFALSRRIVDRPDDYLKPHAKPIPYLGGVAIFLGWAAGLAWAWWRCSTGDLPVPGTGGPSIGGLMIFGIIGAAAVITAVGLLDDVKHMSPAARLLITLLAGVVLVACGLGDDFVLEFARHIGASFLPGDRWLALALSAPVTLFIIVGACNATNVLDGLDGLCAGVMGIIHAGFLGLALYVHHRGSGEAADVLRIVLASGGLGAALGFIPYNRHPAGIFMGDAGSMFLGCNAAILILLFAETEVLKIALAGVMIFALPVGDMALAMFRRRRAGKPMTEGDRSHFYDQLIDRGYSIPKVVAIAYSLAACYAVLGWLAIALPTGYVVALYVVVVVVTAAAVHMAGMVLPEKRDGAGC